MNQLDLFTAEANANKGISRAIDNAGDIWKERVKYLFKTYLSTQREPFLIEDFRAWCKGKIDQPPSNRAFGFVPRFGKSTGLIKFVGYRKTKNPKANGTPASVWQAL